MVFKAVITTTILLSIPDFLGSIGFGDAISSVKELIPLSTFSMGWVLPAGVVLLIVNVLAKKK
jgi:LIVCS family branched-chain amino acid:cation transporter